MKNIVSTRTSIGNTTDKKFQVKTVFASYNIMEKTNTMESVDKKYSNKKGFVFENTNSAKNEQEYSR